MPPKVTVARACQICGAAFDVFPSVVAKGHAKYCSWACAHEAMRGAGVPRAARTERPCGSCGAVMRLLPCQRARKRYCSPVCMYEAKRRVTGPEHPLYRLIERPCEFCGAVKMVKPAKLAEFRFCSRQCHGSAMASFYPRTSSIERALRAELDRRGIAWQGEYRIGPWSVDLAFPPRRLVVEADGDYWHSAATIQQRDKRKDAYLAGHGWRVLRLSESAIKADVIACVDEIVAMLH